MNEEVVCSGCKSKFLVESHEAGMRDKDSLDCPNCRTELLSWNGSTYYTFAKAIKPPTKR